MEGFIPGAIYDDDFESLATKINNIVDVNKPFVVYCGDDESNWTQYAPNGCVIPSWINDKSVGMVS